MSYRFEDGESLYKYAEVIIAGDGKTTYSFHLLYPDNEMKEELKLSDDVVEDFIKKYKEVDYKVILPHRLRWGNSLLQFLVILQKVY
jgi:hypothetical protein